MSEENDVDFSGEASNEDKPVRKRARRVTAEPAAVTETESASENSRSGVDAGSADGADAADTKPKRGRGRPKKADESGADGDDATTGVSTSTSSASSSEAAETSPEASGSHDRQGRNRNRSRNRSGGTNGNGTSDGDGDGESGASDRQGRNRQRDRRRGRGMGDDIEPEILEDDVLLPIGGILDVLDNYAFVRTSGYLPGPQDVYVSLGQVKKYNLRRGDAIIGSIKQPREGENAGRQKFNALVRIDSINGQTIEESASRPDFSSLTALYPQERLRLETDAANVTTRLIDIVAPIGKGERGLVLSPAKAGKSTILREIANAIAENNPEVHLMVVLVDERPEEITDMERSVRGEVIASTFDRPAEDHTMIAELAIERAKRLTELGQDVVVLLDSLTRLGRAYGQSVPASGRVVAGGVDVHSLHPAKKFFGAARKIENGGSLTIIASAHIDSGSRVDEAILDEFSGTANMELRLSGRLAERRIFPAIDVAASGTRHEELLMSDDEVQVMWNLRRALAGLDTQQALDALVAKIKETSSNVEFLANVQRSDAFGGQTGFGA